MTERRRGFGKYSHRTPLPEGFKSWTDLYQTWIAFRKKVGRARKPSVTELFYREYGVTDYIIQAVQPLFRAAELEGDIGQYAKDLIAQVEADLLGVTKARQMVRKFRAQDPAFRTLGAQQATLEALDRRLQDDAMLARNVGVLHPELPVEFLKETIANLARSLTVIRRTKVRMDQLLREREGEG